MPGRKLGFGHTENNFHGIFFFVQFFRFAGFCSEQNSCGYKQGRGLG